MNISIILGLLLALAPVKPETGKFTISQAGKRVGTEEFSITAIKGGYRAEGTTRLDGDPSPIHSKLELDEQLNPLSYEYTHGGGAIRVKVDKPLSELETEAEGQKSSVDFRFPENGVIIDNNVFHHYLLLLYKLSAGGTASVFVPQDMQVGSATVKPKGNRTFELEIGSLKAEATTDADGRMLKLTVPGANVTVER